MHPKTVKYINSYLKYLTTYGDIPGISVAVYEKDKIVYNHSAGLCNVATQEKLTPKHIFRIASHSKVFTSVLIFRLIEEGKLNLEDKIDRYVPMHPKNKKITIRQVLEHRAGISRDGDEKDFWNLNEPFPFANELEFFFQHKAGVFQPDKRYKYSNYGFGLLGLVIEKITGQPYKEYVQKTLLKKYKTICADYEAHLKPYTYGHTPRSVGMRVLPYDEKTNALLSATGYCASPKDLCLFFGDLMNGQILSDSSLEKMCDVLPQSPENTHEFYGKGLEGCVIQNDMWFGHGGGYPGQNSVTLFNKKKQIVITICINVVNMGIRHIFDHILKGLDVTCHTTEWDKYMGFYANIWDTVELIPYSDHQLFIFNPQNLPKRTGTGEFDGKNFIISHIGDSGPIGETLILGPSQITIGGNSYDKIF